MRRNVVEFIKDTKLLNYTQVTIVDDVLSLIWLKFKFFYLPVLVIYSRLIPNYSKGMTFFNFIIIRPKYHTDKGLLVHELVHFRQSIYNLGIHIPLYNFNKKYRYDSELEAYAHQCLVYIQVLLNDGNVYSASRFDFLFNEIITTTCVSFHNDVFSRGIKRSMEDVESDLKVVLLAIIMDNLNVI